MEKKKYRSLVFSRSCRLKPITSDTYLSYQISRIKLTNWKTLWRTFLSLSLFSFSFFFYSDLEFNARVFYIYSGKFVSRKSCIVASKEGRANIWSAAVDENWNFEKFDFPKYLFCCSTRAHNFVYNLDGSNVFMASFGTGSEIHSFVAIFSRVAMKESYFFLTLHVSLFRGFLWAWLEE